MMSILSSANTLLRRLLERVPSASSSSTDSSGDRSPSPGAYHTPRPTASPPDNMGSSSVTSSSPPSDTSASQSLDGYGASTLLESALSPPEDSVWSRSPRSDEDDDQSSTTSKAILTPAPQPADVAEWYPPDKFMVSLRPRDSDSNRSATDSDEPHENFEKIRQASLPDTGETLRSRGKWVMEVVQLEGVDVLASGKASDRPQYDDKKCRVPTPKWGDEDEREEDAEDIDEEDEGALIVHQWLRREKLKAEYDRHRRAQGHHVPEPPTSGSSRAVLVGGRGQDYSPGSSPSSFSPSPPRRSSPRLGDSAAFSASPRDYEYFSARSRFSSRGTMSSATGWVTPPTTRGAVEILRSLQVFDDGPRGKIGERGRGRGRGRGELLGMRRERERSSSWSSCSSQREEDSWSDISSDVFGDDEKGKARGRRRRREDDGDAASSHEGERDASEGIAGRAEDENVSETGSRDDAASMAEEKGSESAFREEGPEPVSAEFTSGGEEGRSRDEEDQAADGSEAVIGESEAEELGDEEGPEEGVGGDQGNAEASDETQAEKAEHAEDGEEEVSEEAEIDGQEDGPGEGDSRADGEEEVEKEAEDGVEGEEENALTPSESENDAVGIELEEAEVDREQEDEPRGEEGGENEDEEHEPVMEEANGGGDEDGNEDAENGHEDEEAEVREEQEDEPRGEEGGEHEDEEPEPVMDEGDGSGDEDAAEDLENGDEEGQGEEAAAIDDRAEGAETDAEGDEGQADVVAESSVDEEVSATEPEPEPEEAVDEAHDEDEAAAEE